MDDMMMIAWRLERVFIEQCVKLKQKHKPLTRTPTEPKGFGAAHLNRNAEHADRSEIVNQCAVVAAW